MRKIFEKKSVKFIPKTTFYFDRMYKSCIINKLCNYAVFVKSEWVNIQMNICAKHFYTS